MFTESVQIHCPYCGQAIDIVIDGSIEQQSYIEDCSVCCRPMELTVAALDGEVAVDVRRDDE